jgi:UDP-N-acetylmuramoyl-L-alanyl-D-glutamate--2,6-diaminopimelate ligase
MNACQAVATAWEVLARAGVEPGERARRLADALSLATAPKGRLEPVHGAGDDLAVFVDFAHSDDALDRVLETVRAASDGELTAVFGCGGDRDTGKRPRMGAAAARHSDRIILTSDNPRSEPPSRIIGEIMDGIPADARARTSVHAERERAIHEAISGAAPGGVVVIAGKGHETDQTGADESGATVTRRFVDQEVARAALTTRRGRAGAATAGAGGAR